MSPAVVVDVESANGQTVSTDDSNVTLTLRNASGAIVATYTEQAVGGVATFADISQTGAGTYTFVASDSTDGLGQQVSNSFTVAAGPSEQLAC